MRLLATVGTTLGLALICASGASAATGDIIAPQHPPLYTADDGWQAGTCTADLPTCSVATPGQFFEAAAAHPPVGFTQFIVKHTTEEVVLVKREKPVGELADVRVDLPVGLSVNPGATPRCDLSQFEASAASCNPLAKVGTAFVTASDPVLGIVAPPLTADVYNLKPPTGEPARFGLELLGNEVFLKADVESGGDFHEGFTIAVPKVLELPGLEGFVLKNRLVFDGTSGDGTFITTPSTCLGPAGTGPGQSGSVYSTWLLAGSYAEEAASGYQFPGSAAPPFESPIPPGTSPKNCATIPYAPGLGVDPGTAQADSPSGATVTATVPHITGGGNQDSSVTRSAAVALPVGMGLNPSAANGLQTCTDGQFPLKGKAPTSCPPQSKVGTVEIQSPPLPEGNLSGDVFVGQQLSRDPESGDEYRIFIDAKSARYGVEVRLLGKVRANATTGQLTTTIAETPQVPFTSFKLAFNGGPRAVLSSPPICASSAAATMTPWSGNPPATPKAPITLTAAPGGGSCAKTLGERPFAPAFSAKPKGTKAGAYSPLSLQIARNDGQQELKGVDITFAPGMTGKLAGIPYCPASALAAAAANGGAAEQAKSSCPPNSLVGSATVAAGTGSAPLRIAGKVFLSGPYRGAPLSLAVVTPATAGPFDLGTVVVRVALFVDPETAQIRAASDPIPSVFGGTQLSVRSVDVDVDRKNFTLNPTSCGPLARPASSTAAAPTRPIRRPSAPSRSAPRSRPATAPRSPSGRSCSRGSTGARKRPSATSTRNSAPSSSPARATPTSAARRSPCRTHSSSTRATSALSAPVCSWPRTTARRRRSTATPGRRRRCWTTNWRARSTSPPPTTNCRTCWPISTGRWTSACGA